MLIAIDGIDGAGKTTLANRLASILRELDPIIEKEPTDQSHWGRRLRQSAKMGRLSKQDELTYFHRDRVEHLQRRIRPALESGKLVILDRYVDSTLAFQADSPDEANKLYQRFEPEIDVPDITFILDCPVEVGLNRIQRSGRKLSQFEKGPTLEKARLIYKSRQASHYCHLDASIGADATLEQAIAALRERFPQLARFFGAQAQDEDYVRARVAG